MTVPEINAVLAQAKNLVSQASNSLSNNKGLGSFGLGLKQLETAGYVKPGVSALADKGASLFSSVAKSPAAWTGKDGIQSKDDFKNNPAVQDKIMEQNLKNNYKTLVRIGGVKEGDDQCAVAGMLAASHLLGAGGAKNWRSSGSGADANGTTGGQYYNMGRYAVDVIATSMVA